MSRILSILSLLAFLPLYSCTTADPDLNPQSSVPPTSSNLKPWNQPQAGQGAGALGMMPQQPRR